MSDPAELTSILEDLADGRIDVTRAADLIAALRPWQARPQTGAEWLYDSPPARAMAGQTDDEQPELAADVQEAPVEKETDDQLSFGIQLEDVAATAGEILKDAGDLARSAWRRIGEFASAVIPEAQQSTQSFEQPPSTVATQPQARPAGKRGIERLILGSVGRRVRLIGDPKVATVAVEGPHTLRRQGVTLEVSTEGELGLNLDSFSVVRPPRSLEDLRVLGFGHELVVRVNPTILVDAEVTGSRLTTVGVPHLGRIRVSAGSANLSGVVEVNDALIQAGGAALSGSFSQGRSRVRVESGNLSIRLSRDANVTVRSQTQLGRVSWPGEPHGDLDELVVGSGAARLDIGVVMGRVAVRLED